MLARRGDLRIPWRREIEFNMGYEWPPSQVIAVVDEALARADIANVARAPAPSCVCWDFDASSIRYHIRYWLTDLSLDELTDSEIRVHGFAALAREGMEMPIPRHELFMNPAKEVRKAAETREREMRVQLLSALELFKPLTDEERLALAVELTPSPFVAGDIATRQGEPADSLYILARGHVGIFHDVTDGTQSSRQRLATLHGPGVLRGDGPPDGPAARGDRRSGIRSPLLSPREARLRGGPPLAAGARDRAVGDAHRAAGGQRRDARHPVGGSPVARNRNARQRSRAAHPGFLRPVASARRRSPIERRLRVSASKGRRSGGIRWHRAASGGIRRQRGDRRA